MKSCIVSQDALLTSPKSRRLPQRLKFRFGSHKCGETSAFPMICVSSRITQLISNSSAGVIVDRCDISTRQLVTPELSNSLSIAKLLRCCSPLPARKVGQKRSAALRTLRRFSAVIKKSTAAGRKLAGRPGSNGELYTSGGLLSDRRLIFRPYIRAPPPPRENKQLLSQEKPSEMSY